MTNSTQKTDPGKRHASASRLASIVRVFNAFVLPAYSGHDTQLGHITEVEPLTRTRFLPRRVGERPRDAIYNPGTVQTDNLGVRHNSVARSSLRV
jgi:hypothetical protein